MKFPQKDFNIDTALRYEPVVKLIEKMQVSEPILEVGSGTNGISDYFEGQVIGVDNDFERTRTKKNFNIKHKRGNVKKLPFKQNTYFITLCMDVLEHVFKEDRKQAVYELLRVTKKGGYIFLGFPSGAKAKFFDNLINFLYKIKTGKDHPWILEHSLYQLPEMKAITKILSEKISEDHIRIVKIIKNVNIFSWFSTHLLFTVLDGTIFNRVFNKISKAYFYFAKINLPPFYRVIFVIKKNEKNN